MTIARPPIDLDGYTGDHARDHALHRERGHALFEPLPDDATDADLDRQWDLIRRDRLLFGLACWHAEVAPAFHRARAAAERAEQALRPAEDDPTARAGAAPAVRAYGCARSNLLVLLDRHPFPAGGGPLYEQYVAKENRVRPTSLPPETTMRHRAGLT
ncbi:hypothetical protein [Embleya sp. NBC_00896]|uniref:hypothetical protein n=1 Tax=Embleya sp. NBC_00896 TaxID=2975961 RepID=UPI0038639B71|nr:hypothetical protein OG928_25060 [Embleya sp. NBC_00896]